MSTPLFVSIVSTFSANVAAGSGTVAQVTYTTPAGKRSVLRFCHVRGRANANAALTTFIFIDIIKNAVSNTVLRRDISGLVGAELNTELNTSIALEAGDLARIVTTNGGAALVNMGGDMYIEEYG